MSLQAKDFCNCEHARMLYKALLEARHVLVVGFANKRAAAIMTAAIAEHDAAQHDYNECHHSGKG